MSFKRRCKEVLKEHKRGNLEKIGSVLFSTGWGRKSVLFPGNGTGWWSQEMMEKKLVSLSSSAVHSSCNQMTLIFFNFSPQKLFYLSRLRVLRHPSSPPPVPTPTHTPIAILLASVSYLPLSYPPWQPNKNSELCSRQLCHRRRRHCRHRRRRCRAGKGGLGGELTLTTVYDWRIVGKS